MAGDKTRRQCDRVEVVEGEFDVSAAVLRDGIQHLGTVHPSRRNQFERVHPGRQCVLHIARIRAKREGLTDPPGRTCPKEAGYQPGECMRLGLARAARGVKRFHRVVTR